VPIVKYPLPATLSVSMRIVMAIRISMLLAYPWLFRKESRISSFVFMEIATG
jgi:hypothetical protein